MKITVELIDKKVNELIEQANNSDNGVIDTILAGIDPQEFMRLVNGQTMGMTAVIADEMAERNGVPAITVAGEAHAMAVTHLALFLFAAGYALRTEEFAEADSITDEDIEAAIGQILGGSNG